MSKLLFIDRSRSCMFCSPFGQWNGDFFISLACEAWGTWWLPNQLHGPCSVPSNGYRWAMWPIHADSSFPDEKEWKKHMKHSLIVDPNLELMCLEVQRVTLMDRCRWHRKRERWYSSWCIKISIAIGSLASRVFNPCHQLQNLFPRIFNNIILIEKHRKTMNINHIKSSVKVP